MNRDQLATEFRRAGIEPGEHLIVHSSLKSLGQVDGGAPTVVEALLDVLGPRGHLLMPTFTYSLTMWSREPFDRIASKSRVGAVTEALRLHPRAVRSFHPTHSVAVVGPEAEEIVRNHLHATPIGEGSPFARMSERGGRILMLGTRQDTNSTLHYCEVAAGLPYVRIPFTDGQDYEVAWFLNELGQIEYTQIFEVPGCSRGFRVVEEPLRRRGVLRDVNIGPAASQLLECQALVQAMRDLLAEQPGMLLCQTESCLICPKRRTFMETHPMG
jgi:aminoglycoside 3-N-acetyltransferase